MKWIAPVLLVLGFSVTATAQPRAYFGKVRGDVGTQFALVGNGASYVQLAGWDQCPNGYYSAGKVFDSNGFWLCIPNGSRSRYWVGNVVADVGYYYSFTPGYRPTNEGTEFFNRCRTGNLIGAQVQADGFWVCEETR